MIIPLLLLIIITIISIKITTKIIAKILKNSNNNNNNNNTAKVILKKDNRITLYCKGADCTVFDLCSRKKSAELVKTTNEHLSVCGGWREKEVWGSGESRVEVGVFGALRGKEERAGF